MKRSAFSRLVPLHLLGYLGCVLAGSTLVVGVRQAPAFADQVISFQDLNNTNVCLGRDLSCNRSYKLSEVDLLSDYDEIQYQFESQADLGATEVELGFRSLLDWAKEVRVVDASGRELIALEAEDGDTRLRRTTVDTSYLKGGKLVFVKGKMFGVRAKTYDMPLTDEILEAIAGKRVTFIWVQD